MHDYIRSSIYLKFFFQTISVVPIPRLKFSSFSHIIPYLKKHGVNPVTGKKMAAKDLIHLKFSKDSEGKPS